jgi:nitroimidazol reductase NimA-like FMN-containing flavoprotein (pyridoxamine 5'-phosphate oxidase superfamily)
MKTRSNVRELSREEIDAFLRSQRVGTLSMNDGINSYAVPLAYFYDGEQIYLTIGGEGRKMAYIKKNKNVCFVVCWTPENFGLQNMSWKSVICDGMIEHVTDPDGIRKAAQTGEKHLGMPAGAWDKVLEMTLKKPEASNFWKIKPTQVGGKGVEGFKEEFIE